MANLDNLTDRQIRARNDFTRDARRVYRVVGNRVKKLLAWLRINPYSTSEEAVRGCGVSPGSIYGTPRKFIRWKKDYKGETRWYVDAELEQKVLNNP